jgi:hypothetical protein
MINKILHSYTNGNTKVTIYEDGTKVREFENIPEINHPESIDVKITNYCDMGCEFCHESSTKRGKHADLEKLQNILYDLPAGIELAIGGGNPLDHPDLIEFLVWCQMMGFIANMTVNQAHLKKFMPTIETLLEEKLIMGLGISINGNDWASVKYLKTLSDNIVYHVIAGVHKINILSRLEELGNCKVLILGYKTFGRGLFYFYENTGVLNIMRKWKEYIRQYLGSSIISFDNLALEQLDIKSLMSPKFWETFYMGDDFTFTMYIDAVNEEYAPTSRSADNRVKFNDMSLFSYFQEFKGSFKE